MLELNRIYCGDSLELMKSIPSKSIDLVLTDPPYGITDCEWDTVPDLDNLWIELKRVGKERTAYVFTASQPFTTDLINSNRKWFKYCLVWIKTKASNFQSCRNSPMKRHEDIIVFCDGATVFNLELSQLANPIKNSRRNKGGNLGHIKGVGGKLYFQEETGFSFSDIYFENGNNFSKHPTQKPVKLMQYLIKTYSNEGDTILDPFLGSGSTALACLMEGKNFIGIEREQKYCDIAEKRIDLYKRQGKLDL